MFLEDFRFAELVVVPGGSLEGPAESLDDNQYHTMYENAFTYPGLDITAGVFPFLLREGATAARGGGGGGSSDSEIFCRLGRLEAEDFAVSGSGAGLGSRAVALRFLDGGAGRVDEADDIAPAELFGDSEEPAACLAAALVILLEGMSMCVCMKKSL